MARSPELTFKKYGKGRTGGHWGKKIDGKIQYFGTRRNRSDTPSYKAAVAKYRKFMEKRSANHHLEEIARTLYHSRLAAAGIQVEESAPVLTPQAIAEGSLDHLALPNPDQIIHSPDDHGKSLDDLMVMIRNKRRLSQ